MNYVTIFHANLNYAYLVPERYEFVIRHSYELILDTMRAHFPRAKFVFEASGYTIEQIALKTPDVLDKLRQAIADGRCEFMGSPYAHPMLPNFPEQDGVWSITFSNRIYEKYLGMRPVSFWNPECGWRGYVPKQVLACGYKNLVGDFEAYSRSCAPDGTPLRPEIYEKEHTKEPAFYSFGFKYDLPGTERAIHFPFNRVHGLEDDALRVFLRSDRVAQFGVRFFMGMQGYSFEQYLALIDTYSQQPAGEPRGALIVFADDAEYVGTNGWFRLKYQNLPDNTFEPTPQSRDNLIKLISACQQRGALITFDEACRLQPLPEQLTFDDDSAWHGARASTWATTPMATLLRPWQDLVRAKLNDPSVMLDPDTRDLAWFHLTTSYNSDGQWPPTLPDAPHIIHPFNYRYCFENLLKAELLVGGVDRGKLSVDPVQTLEQILGPQQRLVADKAKTMLASKDRAVHDDACRALALVERTRDVTGLRASKPRVLYPDEYTIRADALVEARRLVGGVLIEKS